MSLFFNVLQDFPNRKCSYIIWDTDDSVFISILQPKQWSPWKNFQDMIYLSVCVYCCFYIFIPAQCCRRLCIPLSTGETTSLLAEWRGEELSCILLPVRRCSRWPPHQATYPDPRWLSGWFLRDNNSNQFFLFIQIHKNTWKIVLVTHCTNTQYIYEKLYRCVYNHWRTIKIKDRLDRNILIF